MTKAQKSQSLDDISNAVMVLHVFGEELFDHHTCRLISSAPDLSRNCAVSGSGALKMLDLSHTGSIVCLRTTVPLWKPTPVTAQRLEQNFACDYHFKTRIYKVYCILFNLNAICVGHPADNTRRVSTTRQHRKTPREVIKALPRCGRLSVCMKHLSAPGCVSKSDDKCAFPNHARFTPADLPDIVREHITSQLGGLRAELSRSSSAATALPVHSGRPMSDNREGSYQILRPYLLPLLSTENSVALCRSWWPRSHFHWRTEYRYGGKNPTGTLAQTRRSIRCGWTSYCTDIINALLWRTLQSEAFHAVLPARGPLTGSQYAIITALAPTGRHWNAVLLAGKHPEPISYWRYLLLFAGANYGSVPLAVSPRQTPTQLRRHG
ncbi:hypothetical protein JG687_00011186 [Phytophthora cactorum]|uniref:Uncharacterized protein n=1 Tax=Phytophthora cactorum TaxID=29920 RepID=A0A8T1U937_9STRA|nr:hypothetical protein JG687_00011186 [Phytophthora cactorum]